MCHDNGSELASGSKSTVASSVESAPSLADSDLQDEELMDISYDSTFFNVSTTEEDHIRSRNHEEVSSI